MYADLKKIYIKNLKKCEFVALRVTVGGWTGSRQACVPA